MVSGYLKKERQVMLEIYVAVCENTERKVVNRFGKKLTFHYAGFRAGFVISAGESYVATNRRATNAHAAACWAVLRAVELALMRGERECLLIKAKAQAGWRTGGSAKNQYFLDLARAKAALAGLRVEFEHCSKNPAFAVADAEGAPWFPKQEEEPLAIKWKLSALVHSFENERGNSIYEKEEHPAAPAPLAVPVSIGIPDDLRDSEEGV
jgi:hypothetical protein